MGPHVVVIPLPVHGHFNPLLQLSVQLASRGVTVSFITTDSTKPRVLAALSSILALSGKEEEEDEDGQLVRSNLRFLSLFDGDCSEKLEEAGDPGIWHNIIFMSSKADEIEQMLESSARELGAISCMILDFLVLYKIKELATKRGIPVALFWTSSPAYLLLTMHLRTLVERGYAPLKIESNEDCIDSSLIPGIPQLRLCDDLPFTLQSGIEPDPGFENTCKLKQHFLDAQWVLVNTFQELDDDALCAVQKEGVKIVTVGPLLPLELRKNTRARLDVGSSDEILEWLSTQERSSVLYVSFGTQADLPSEQVEELAYALEASGQPFLWVLRPGHSSKLPESFLEGFGLRTEGRGLVVSWCNQLHVLRHPSVGGFLTHGGWNSILESICYGVPMIGWPCMAEQNLNCKYMADVWEIGTRILTTRGPDGNGKRVERGEIERAITGLMASQEGKKSRKRAAQLREAARRAVQVDGSSHGNIDDLVQAFKSPTFVSQESC